MKIAHLIGNGPTWVTFKDGPRVGDIWGCNLGHDELDMIAVFIHDGRVFRHISKHKLELKFPVIGQFNHIKTVSDKLITTYDILPNECKERSSGHDGLHYLIEKRDYNEIHLWGFDSITKNNAESVTGERIPDSKVASNQLSKWKAKFEELFEKAKDRGIDIIVH